MKEKIVVIGGGGHAKVIISILKKIENYEVIGYTDLEKKELLLGIRWLGGDEVLAHIFENGIKKAVIGIGQVKTSEYRKKIVNKLKTIGFEYPQIVSPKSIINEGVQIGIGTVIMDGAIVNSGTTVGEFSIINTNSSIDHDCSIGNYVHIAPGVTLSGGTNVSDDVLIGTGSSLIQCIRIERNIIIGAGSVVIQNLLEPGNYAGNPARKLI